MAIAFAAAFWSDRRALRFPLLIARTVFFVGISMAAFQWWFLESNSFENSLQASVREGDGVLGKPEYAPPGIPFPQVDRIVSNACLLDTPPNAPLPVTPAWDGESASCSASSWHEAVLLSDLSHSAVAPYLQEQKRIIGVAEHPGYLILRLRYYPAWSVTVNGIPVTPKAERERGLMAVPVPQGKDLVAVDWTTTSDVVAGRCVSAAALLLIAGLYSFERKRLRAHSPVATDDPNPRNPLPSASPDNRNKPPGKHPKTARRK
jgi:hypothetical protein